MQKKFGRGNLKFDRENKQQRLLRYLKWTLKTLLADRLSLYVSNIMLRFIAVLLRYTENGVAIMDWLACSPEPIEFL